MSARQYCLGKRQIASDKIGEKIIEAARDLLMSKKGLTEFSMEHIAQKAGVTRLTIYNQFGSKLSLLESVYDNIGRRGGIVERLSKAMMEDDPEVSLNAVVDAFIQFWDAEKTALRRLRSLAVLNPDFKGMRKRDERRRLALEAVIVRVMDRHGQKLVDTDGTIDTVTMLTSFEAFDTMARSGTPIAKIISRIQRLVHLSLMNDEKGSSSGTLPNS